MLKDLIWITQQAVGQAGGEAAWLLVAAVAGYLIRRLVKAARRLGKGAPKADRTRKCNLDIGTLRVTATITIGRKPRKLPSGPDADDE